jgi:hypothetical protein
MQTQKPIRKILAWRTSYELVSKGDWAVPTPSGRRSLIFRGLGSIGITMVIWPEWFGAAVMLLMVAITVAPAHGAEVSCVVKYDGTLTEAVSAQLWPSGFRPAVGTCQRAYIHRSILKGDYEKVRSLYRDNHPLLNVFYLVSSGGSIEEAIKIGKLFRRYLITAWAPVRVGGEFLLAGAFFRSLCQGSECVCASACALIWFGAVSRVGVVGLHRPRIADPPFKEQPPAEAAEMYQSVLDEIARYMGEMEVPRPMIDGMVATASSEIRWVDYDHDGLSRPPSFVE